MLELYPCMADHQPPPDSVLPIPRAIGYQAGFGLYSLMLGAGGFGLTQGERDALQQINDTYRAAYAVLHKQAVSIHIWVRSPHIVYDPLLESPAVCPTCGVPHSYAEFQQMELDKAATMADISLQIDTLSIEAKSEVLTVIPAAKIEAYQNWLKTFGV